MKLQILPRGHKDLEFENKEYAGVYHPKEKRICAMEGQKFIAYIVIHEELHWFIDKLFRDETDYDYFVGNKWIKQMKYDHVSAVLDYFDALMPWSDKEKSLNTTSTHVMV